MTGKYVHKKLKKKTVSCNVEDSSGQNARRDLTKCFVDMKTHYVCGIILSKQEVVLVPHILEAKSVRGSNRVQLQRNSKELGN